MHTSFKCNLISTSELILSHHCCLAFLHNYCFIQDLSTWTAIGMGRLEAGLYHFQPSNIPSSEGPFHNTYSTKSAPHQFNFVSPASVNNGCNKVTNDGCIPSFTAVAGLPIELWHYRLGHVSHDRISLLHKAVPEIVSNFDFHCNICPMAKQHRLPFPNSVHVSRSIFELIHYDI